MYAKALKNAAATKQLNGDTTELTKEEIKKYYDENVDCDVIKIYDIDNIYLEGCTVNADTKKYNYGKKLYYANGDVVYFDIEKGKSCTEEEYKKSYSTDFNGGDYLNSKTGYNGYINIDATYEYLTGMIISVEYYKTQKLDKQNTCLKFYAFNDEEGSTTVNLILDHNTMAVKEWINQTDYADDTNWNNRNRSSKGPITLLRQLKEDTKEWQGLETPKNYTDARGYTINYTTLGMKARLIEAKEIAQITGYKNWNDNFYYFDTNTSSLSDTCKFGNTTRCKYGWLYDRTSINCKAYGCLNNADLSMGVAGYWTSSANTSDLNTAWYVYREGFLSYWANVDYMKGYGVRPVITVLKSNLS